MKDKTNRTSSRIEVKTVTTEPKAKMLVINSNGIGESIITGLVLQLQKVLMFLIFRLTVSLPTLHQKYL